MTVVYDVQALQSPDHAERGIARYVSDLATALGRSHPGLVSRLAVNPDRPVPAAVERLSGIAPIEACDVPLGDARVYHVTSPFEPGISLERLWPAWARRAGLRLVVSLYDVIPMVYADHYLRETAERRRYLTRAELVRRGDRVVTISASSAADALGHLGLRRDRLVVAGAAPAAAFRPPTSRTEATAAAVSAVPGLRPGYLLCTGGTDFRKNVAGLLAAYAQLPLALRRRHQLAIVCALTDEQRRRYSERVEALGAAQDVLFTGQVTDEDLVALYQGASLFVFPSLYEGYGLPVAEALACGTPVVCSDTPALRDLVPDAAARFDPEDLRGMTSAMAGALDRSPEMPVRPPVLGPAHRWEAVADRVAATYAELGRRGRRPPRPRIAYVSPLPPLPSGIADYSFRLLGELRRFCDIDVYVDRSERDVVVAPAGVNVHAIPDFETVEAARGGYHRLVYCLGNQILHGSALGMLRGRPGDVIAHDLRLTGLYSWCADHRPDVVGTAGFHALLHGMYAGLPSEIGRAGFVEYRDADRHRIFMARDAIASATRFYVHSEAAAAWARGDAYPGDAAKVRLLPFAAAEATVRPDPDLDAPLVASFGVVDPIKQSPKVLEAFPAVRRQVPTARLALVGPLPESVRDEYRHRARQLGLEDSVVVTGRVADDEYQRWLGQASVGVQLRASSGGESSAAAADCLAHGLATVVTDIGFTGELPDAAVRKVPVDIPADELGQQIVDLLRDHSRRQAMGRSGALWAAAHSYARVAEAFYRDVVLGASVPAASPTTAMSSAAT